MRSASSGAWLWPAATVSPLPWQCGAVLVIAVAGLFSRIAATGPALTTLGRSGRIVFVKSAAIVQDRTAGFGNSSVMLLRHDGLVFMVCNASHATCHIKEAAVAQEGVMCWHIMLDSLLEMNARQSARNDTANVRVDAVLNSGG